MHVMKTNRRKNIDNTEKDTYFVFVYKLISLQEQLTDIIDSSSSW